MGTYFSLTGTLADLGGGNAVPSGPNSTGLQVISAYVVASQDPSVGLLDTAGGGKLLLGPWKIDTSVEPWTVPALPSTAPGAGFSPDGGFSYRIVVNFYDPAGRGSRERATNNFALTANSTLAQVLPGFVLTAVNAAMPYGYSGTGSPEGVVTAAVGSRYTDTAITRGALEWFKASGTGNTGWLVSIGDTGWRNVATLLINGWTTGFIQLGRRNGVVFHRLVGLNGSAKTGDTYMSKVAGFGMAGALGQVPVAYGASRVEESGGMWFVKGLTQDIYSTLTWPTDDPWPTTLPGTAA